MILYFKKYKILLLFSIIPIGYLISYILEKLIGVNISSYFILLSILYLYYINNNELKYKSATFLFLYTCFNVFYFEGNLNANAREIITFIMYLATIYCLPFLRDSIVKVNINHLKKFYNYFINTFVLLFIITALIEGKAVYEEMAGGRYYYNGFVISHQFSYFSVLFGFILLKNKQNLKASIVFILALSVGNRISYLLLISVFYLYVENKYDKGFLGNKLLRAVSFVVLLLLILFVVMLCINTSWGTVSNLLIEDDYRDFTSGRSLFWYNGLDKLLKLNFFSFNSWFGFGPDSVEVLASKLYDNHFWMHNDFMQIWYCYGFVGLALYSHGLYLLVKEFKTLSILWPILLTSMLNGFYTYGALQIFIMLIYIYIVKVHFSKKNIFLTKRNQIEYVPRLVK